MPKLFADFVVLHNEYLAVQERNLYKTATLKTHF